MKLSNFELHDLDFDDETSWNEKVAPPTNTTVTQNRSHELIHIRLRRVILLIWLSHRYVTPAAKNLLHSALSCLVLLMNRAMFVSSTSVSNVTKKSNQRLISSFCCHIMVTRYVHAEQYQPNGLRIGDNPLDAPNTEPEARMHYQYRQSGKC